METQEVHYIVCFSKDKSYVTSKLILLLKLIKKIQKHHFPGREWGFRSSVMDNHSTTGKGVDQSWMVLNIGGGFSEFSTFFVDVINE